MFLCKTATCLILMVLINSGSTTTRYKTNSFECGPYGFICEGTTKLRLCEGENLRGPAFLCPANTKCNEDSSDVCVNLVNYVESPVIKNIRCHRNERIADPNVSDCKGYILCIPNKDRFQGIKFQCAGHTIFNGYTRTCSSPDKYHCPLIAQQNRSPDLFVGEKRRIEHNPQGSSNNIPSRPIECKNYKFKTDDKGPVRAAYFCPPRPVVGENNVRCTVFSSKFCITLERDDEDQFTRIIGAPYRRPRM